MVDKVLAVGLLLGVSSCTLLLGRYDDSGTGSGGSAASSGPTTTASASGTGTGTASASGSGGTTASSGGAGGATSGSASSASSSSGTGGTCMDPHTDCPTPATKCILAGCNASDQCVTAHAPLSTPCSDSNGAVCDGQGSCVGCLADGNCSNPAAPACDTASSQCVACTAGNATACSGGTPTCNVSTHLCGPACVGDSDCGSGRYCIYGKCYAPGDALTQVNNGPGVTLPACGGDFVAMANAACTGTYPGTHWCTVADANGTGTYHAELCAGMFPTQFNGGNTQCNSNAWIADQWTGCTGGVVSYSPQIFAQAGDMVPVNCCR